MNTVYTYWFEKQCSITHVTVGTIVGIVLELPVLKRNQRCILNINTVDSLFMLGFDTNEHKSFRSVTDYDDNSRVSHDQCVISLKTTRRVQPI